jgi:hypothetical protein
VLYELTFKCGHKEKVSITGPKEFKEIRANELQKELCPKCKEKK